MPTSFEEANNDQLVNGAVESAMSAVESVMNELTGDLSFPENFPTDAPEQNAEGQQSQVPQEGAYAPVDGQQQNYHLTANEVKTFTSKKKKKEEPYHNTGRWTEAEHYTFLQGVGQHGKDCTKIAAMIPSRTTLQVRTHAQKYFQKLEKGTLSTTALDTEMNAAYPQPEVHHQGEGITSPIAAQTLLGMSQLATGAPTDPQEQRGSKRKLSTSKKDKKSNQCKYKDCKNKIHQQTQACLKHQHFLCTFPNCGDMVEIDNRFSQKRELCKVHYRALTNRPRSMFPSRADRP